MPTIVAPLSGGGHQGPTPKIGVVLAARVVIERADELDGLDRFATRVAAGEGSAVVIEGPAGIGKTTLMQHARACAEAQGWQVYDATGSELETDLPFGAVRQLFGALLAHPHRESIFAGAAELARPVLDLSAATASGPDALAPALHGLHWLALTIAEAGPVLLTVDDAQWADAESLRWLSYLIRRLGAERVGVVLTVRTGAVPEHDALFATLRTLPAVTVLRPQPLSVDATRRLVQSRAGEVSERFCDAAHAVCAGNPFLVEELIDTCVADGRALNDEGASRIAELASDQVARAVLIRIGRISDAAVQVARAVAILGSSANVPRLALMTGASVDDVAGIIERLINADVVAPGLPLRFRHPLVRQSVYNDVPAALRAARHREAATMLLDDAVADGSELVAQLLVSEPLGDARAVPVLRSAAARAVATGAPVAAVHALSRATREPVGDQMPAVLLELGKAEVAAGLDGIPHLRQALGQARDADQRLEAAISLANAVAIAGDNDQALRILDDLQAAVASSPDRQARLAAAWCTLALQLGRRREVYARCVALDEHGLTAAARRRLDASLALCAPSRAERARFAAAAWDDGGLLDTADPELLLPILVVGSRVEDGDHQLAATMASVMFARARQLGSPLAVAMAAAVRAQTHWAAGRSLDAETDATLALELAEQCGWQAGVQFSFALVVRTLVDAGRYDEANRLLENLPEGVDPTAAPLRLVRGYLRLYLGHPDQSLAEAAAIAAVTDPRAPDDVFEHQFLTARAMAALGDRAAARKLATAKLAEIAATDLAIAVADGTIAVADCAEPADAVRAWRDASDALDQMPFRLHRVRALLALGTALRHDRRPAEAREPLQRALDLAVECQASGLVTHAEEELGAAGAQPRRRPPLGVEALSPSERRVCRLATDGLSNVAIAQALFVSVKTVETQLSSAYRKLGISRRGDLAGVLPAT